MNTTIKLNSTLSSLITACVIFHACFALHAQDVPAWLPDPDGRAGDSSKPVKVYILAGQSNMVGMGDLSGARNIYTGVYLSSDPAIAEGPFQIYRVGNFKATTLSVFDIEGSPTQRAVDEGFLEVPQSGVYRIHCGFGDRSYNVMRLDGEEVYRRELGEEPESVEVTLRIGQRYAFEIRDFEGDTPRFWMEKTDLLGNGDLEAVAKREGKFPWLVDDDNEWTVRHDVYFQEARLAENGSGSPLSATSNGRSIGPELGFGHVLGTYHDEQVLLIKTAQGNRSLGFDFRPPSSGRTDPDNEFESAEYRLMVEGVRKTLDDIENVVPNYQGQGYEIAGFVWFQGHKDSGTDQSINEYEQHLVNLINDVRSEYEKPELPVVVATVGFGGRNMQEKFLRILNAQLAVGDATEHPEFEGTVASVDTRDYWREVDESPTNQDYHYNRNAETYMLIGDSLGRAMVNLIGGEAEPLPLPVRPTRVVNQPSNDLSEEAQAIARRALTPIIIDGIAATYTDDPRYRESLIQEATGERPERPNQFLRGAMFGLVNCYAAAGIDEYDWHSFRPNLDEAEWAYFSFDPPETLPLETGNRYRTVTLPTGMENWFAADFDAAEHGWQRGLQPFGQLDGELASLSDSCASPFCRCGETPKSLWENEVLLVQGTFEFPPLKEGHRYRIVVGGSAHVNSGEGFAIYLDGRKLQESDRGVAVRQGGQPRGAHIYEDFRDAFDDGVVTISATSFLRYNHPRNGVQPPRGHFSIWVEEMKLPPLP